MSQYVGAIFCVLVQSKPQNNSQILPKGEIWRNFGLSFTTWNFAWRKDEISSDFGNPFARFRQFSEISPDFAGSY